MKTEVGISSLQQPPADRWPDKSIHSQRPLSVLRFLLLVVDSYCRVLVHSTISLLPKFLYLTNAYIPPPEIFPKKLRYITPREPMSFQYIRLKCLNRFDIFCLLHHSFQYAYETHASSRLPSSCRYRHRGILER